jgi:hypothetical protein
LEAGYFFQVLFGEWALHDEAEKRKGGDFKAEGDVGGPEVCAELPIFKSVGFAAVEHGDFGVVVELLGGYHVAHVLLLEGVEGEEAFVE